MATLYMRRDLSKGTDAGAGARTRLDLAIALGTPSLAGHSDLLDYDTRAGTRVKKSKVRHRPRLKKRKGVAGHIPEGWHTPQDQAGRGWGRRRGQHPGGYTAIKGWETQREKEIIDKRG